MIPLSPACRLRLDAMFPPAWRAQAEELLTEQCGATLPYCLEVDNPEDFDRIRFAVLKLSDGRFEKLRHWVAEANKDWRDVLVAAGFANDGEIHLRWVPHPHPHE